MKKANKLKRNMVLLLIGAVMVVGIMSLIKSAKNNKNVSLENKNSNNTEIGEFKFDVENLKSEIEKETEIEEKIMQLKSFDEQLINEYENIDKKVEYEINLLLQSNPNYLKEIGDMTEEQLKEKIKQEKQRELGKKYSIERQKYIDEYNQIKKK